MFSIQLTYINATVNELIKEKKYIVINEVLGGDADLHADLGNLGGKTDIDKLKKLDTLKPDPKNPGKNQ